MKLKNIFKAHVSSGSFTKIDGELRIVGKFGQISMIDDVFDIWFVSEPHLTENKLTALLKNIPENVSFTRLDPEAHIQTSDLALVLKLLPVCGIRRRKYISPEDKKKLIKRLEGRNANNSRTNSSSRKKPNKDK